MKDPIKKAEDIVRGVNDGAGKYTQPVLRRYPLLFSFLSVFSFAAILGGFNIWIEKIEVFQRYPSLLMIIGIIALLFTGTLYKNLNNIK
jgi:hypothetical protein